MTGIESEHSQCLPQQEEIASPNGTVKGSTCTTVSAAVHANQTLWGAQLQLALKCSTVALTARRDCDGGFLGGPFDRWTWSNKRCSGRPSKSTEQVATCNGGSRNNTFEHYNQRWLERGTG